MSPRKSRSKFALPELDRGERRRPARVADYVREEIAMLLIRKIKDPRVYQTTITNVSVSPDLRQARVLFSNATQDPASVAEGLNSAKGFIRSHLARELGMRYVPDLDFRYDSSIEHQAEMSQIFREIARDHDDDTP
ncbi:MAG: 30S ribosome-binding factor RbfA [Proteobacteria bacterium]|nr:30S ribosome-binding factor RbfA [Pseudomonadota bacterium]MBU1685979.1 30S ribosome-binding factor RbfA [Pseudomonadota bacterium]